MNQMKKINMSALDVQISGDHYKSMKIQPVEFITANNIPFLEGNVIKYVCRHMSKNGLSDIDKAIHYLELIKELRYNEELKKWNQIHSISMISKEEITEKSFDDLKIILDEKLNIFFIENGEFYKIREILKDVMS